MRPECAQSGGPSQGYRQVGWRRAVKRALDVTVAVVGLVATAPILCAVASLVWFRLGSPVLFRQTRPGLRGEPFVLFKFRTMQDLRDEQGRLLPDAERIPPFGRWLRSTSLDELPQLWNVVRGDLSLVGPRPLLMSYLDRYSADQARRHDVLPGITGWSQANGRNAISWEDKLALDLWYVDNWSLLLDVRIVARTIRAVARRTGVTNPGSASMPEFMGSRIQREEDAQE